MAIAHIGVFDPMIARDLRGMDDRQVLGARP